MDMTSKAPLFMRPSAYLAPNCWWCMYLPLKSDNSGDILVLRQRHKKYTLQCYCQVWSNKSASNLHGSNKIKIPSARDCNLIIAGSRRLSRKRRKLNLIQINSIVRLPTDIVIILRICGMQPSVFERLHLWMVEWFGWKMSKHHENKEFVATLVLLQPFPSITIFPSINIFKLLWRLYCEKKITITKS